ncbi:MAG: nucleoside triphosphate pyrophosphohydrolase [Chloroflexales bacterium]|nr:nucleoside triphosphate pyrophosphohydrolase [Chloroflexales bacterium]
MMRERNSRHRSSFDVTMPTIVLIGLGPGDPELVTPAAQRRLQQAATIYTPAPEHPALAQVMPARAHPYPELQPDAIPNWLYDRAIAEDIVVCALPGHPYDHPLTTALQNVPSLSIQLVPGVSLLDASITLLGLSGRSSGFQVLPLTECLDFRLTDKRHSPDYTPAPAWSTRQGIGPYTAPRLPYPLIPTQPALLWCYQTSPEDQSQPQDGNTPNSIAVRLREALSVRYPPTHPLHLIYLDWSGNGDRIMETRLADLGGVVDFQQVTAIYLPPLDCAEDQRGFDGLNWVAARLLGPNGCPWDHAQSHQTLRSCLLEEVHEVLEALDHGDMTALAEELGDLLFQVLVHSEMARQAGYFSVNDVIAHIMSKMIRRHPHVFGNLTVDNTATVLQNWDQIKAQELADKGQQRSSALDGLPASLPALAAAQKIIKKAARTGFAWSNLQEVWAKLHEELNELAQASQSNNHDHLAEEYGDVLFVLANLGGWLNLDAESVLREANAKFQRRFRYVEQSVQKQTLNLETMTAEEMLALWVEAKRNTQP